MSQIGYGYYSTEDDINFQRNSLISQEIYQLTHKKAQEKYKFLNLFSVMALIITNSSLWLTLSPISRKLSCIYPH